MTPRDTRLTCTRRRLLAAAAGAGCAAVFSTGCSTHRAPCSGSNRVTLYVDPGAFFAKIPGLQSAVDRAGLGLNLVPAGAPTAPGGIGSPFRLVEVNGHSPPTTYGDLANALTIANLGPGQFLPGMFDAFRVGQGVFGVPLLLQPTLLAWRRDAFKAAKQQAPQSGWNVDTFMAVCQTLAELVRAQTIPGLRRVFPAMVGHRGATDFANFGQLATQPVAWAGWLLSAGVQIASNGHFDVSTPACVAALSQFTEVMRRYGEPLPNERAYPLGGSPDQNDACALQFVPYPNGPFNGDPRWAYAVPPVVHREVIPMTILGIGVDIGMSAKTRDVTSMLTEEIGSAVLRFVGWLASPTGARALLSAGLPSALAYEGAQAAFYRRYSTPWSHQSEQGFVDWMSGWPVVANDGNDVALAVYRAIQSGVYAPDSLDYNLQTASHTMNGYLDRQTFLVSVTVPSGSNFSLQC